MALEHDLDSALANAVRIAGSQSAFGRLISTPQLRVPQQTVHSWLKGDKPLPAEHVLKVEAETGVSRHDLRPDLYPRDDQFADAGKAIASADALGAAR